MKQTISVLVENQAGVLNRITIIVDSGNNVVEQVEKQLNKLVEVIKVRTLEENNLIGRELMILKVNANNKTRQDIMTVCKIMNAKVADISPTSMTLELSDTPDRLDTFQSLLKPFSILEVARTGVIAVQKGGGKI
ncbi:MAG: acetolactate synthase small subunit [Oscillibacter sp.]|nr:acetolactate synthase small subunit [Oscillibacter sp.]